MLGDSNTIINLLKKLLKGFIINFSSWIHTIDELKFYLTNNQIDKTFYIGTLSSS